MISFITFLYYYITAYLKLENLFIETYYPLVIFQISQIVHTYIVAILYCIPILIKIIIKNILYVRVYVFLTCIILYV